MLGARVIVPRPHSPALLYTPLQVPQRLVYLPFSHMFQTSVSSSSYPETMADGQGENQIYTPYTRLGLVMFHVKHHQPQ